MGKFSELDKRYLEKRRIFSEKLKREDLYELIDQFALYAGTQTLGTKIYTYELLKKTLQVPGHIIEFGCWKGANLLFLAKMMSLLQPSSPKKILGFDNFEGLPQAVSQDGEYANGFIGRYKGDELTLKQVISLFDFDNTIELIKGDAVSTIPKFKEARKDFLVSFAYIDFDLYEPTKVALDFLEEVISIGGIIVFDEALSDQWPGETNAMKEYMSASKIKYEMIANDLSRQPTVALRRIE